MKQKAPKPAFSCPHRSGPSRVVGSKGNGNPYRCSFYHSSCVRTAFYGSGNFSYSNSICHVDTGGACNLNSCPLCSPDCTVQRTSPLLVCGFSLVMDIAPGHGDRGVIVSSPLPTRSRFWGTVIHIGFCPKLKLVSSTQARSFPWRVLHRVTWV